MLRGAVIGCGFFAEFHVSAWDEIEGVELVAACDLDLSRARTMASRHDIAGAYADAAEMLASEEVDFVDVVTRPDSHRPLVELAAEHGLHVICQKPLAPSLDDARAAVEACANVTFMVHENFRWQHPMRALKQAAAEIGEMFFGRIHFRSAFDVYANQPYLARDERFIVYDLGVHLLDLARFFFGEIETLYCVTQRVNPAIRAEDVATMLLRARSGATVVVDLSYASKLDEETFPQTLVHLEGTEGTAVLSAGYDLAVTTPEGTTHRAVPPPAHAWSLPPSEAVHDSILNIQRHWVNCLREGRQPETSGRDNLRTLALVFGAYASASTRKPVQIDR